MSVDLRPSNRWFITLTALSLWLGWGIRGNFGHEYGAMMPGALAAIAAVLLVGRDDWRPRIAFFGMLGALGWSFGGSISYMQVVAYTHSGDSMSVLYGFACLFVIGFLWAAPGGAGTALAAVVDRRFLSDLFWPMGAVFFLWWLQGVALDPWLRGLGIELTWYDTDWLAAALAIVAGLAVWISRGRRDPTSSLVLYLAVGWWAGFALLVLVLGLRMTPPRGDNWAGCLGMTAGLFWYCRHFRMGDVARAALQSGFIGGIGFAAASMLKLVEVTSGYATNWHSILEQTTGLFNGVGIAVAVASLARRAKPIDDEHDRRPWTEALAIGFVTLAIPYLNARKNVQQWISTKSVPAVMAGLPLWVWFDLVFTGLAIAFLILWLRHRREPLAVLPSSWYGKGQLLYLFLLWTVVIFNFERALVAFTAQRLVTEGVLYVVALAATIVLLCAPAQANLPALELPLSAPSEGRSGLRYLVAAGLLAAVLSVGADWAIVRAVYGDRFAGHSKLHVRFGPNATWTPSINR